jgi:hypothetical protein
MYITPEKSSCPMQDACDRYLLLEVATINNCAEKDL